MSAYLYAGFRLTDLSGGSFDLDLVEDPGGTADAFSVTSSLETIFAHVDFSAGVSGAQDLATWLQAALRAGSPNGYLYVVTWDEATTAYTISGAGNDFDLTTFVTAGTSQVLGMSAAGTWTGATTYTSNVRPTYLIVPAMEDKSKTGGGVYEGEAEVVQAWSLDGTAYGHRVGVAPQFESFTLQHEPHAAVKIAQATAAVPWTYEAFWKHVGPSLPWMLRTDVDVLYKLSQRAALWDQRARVQEIRDNDVLWAINFRCVFIADIT